jgi:hypothetical protein
VYFLIANLWAVPLTALVLYTGVLLFLLNWMPWVPHLLAAILEGSLTLLHAGTMEMEKLPCLSLYPVFLQKSSVFFLLGILLLVHKGFSEKRTTPLFVSGLLGVLLLGFSLMGEVRDRKRTLLTFYPSRENYCISLYDHGVFYGNTEKEALTPEITGHMLSLSVSPHAYVMLPARQAIKTREYPEQDPWLRVDDYLIFSHNSSMHLPRKTPPRPVDILVFSEYAPPDWKVWLRSLNPQFVLFSRENDRYFTTGNQQTAEPVQLLNIEEEGGLIFRLDGGLRMVKK